MPTIGHNWDPLNLDFVGRVEIENRIGNMTLDLADTKGKLQKERDKYSIDKIIFNPPATVVIWKDGEKTIVKCGEDEVFDHEVGVAMCFMKKIFGSRSAFKRTVKGYKPKEPKKEAKKPAETDFDDLARKFGEAAKELRRALYGGGSCSEK